MSGSARLAQSSREAHTSAAKRDGSRYALSDYDIDLAFALAEVGGVVCACGAHSEEFTDDWGLIDNRPCCGACIAVIDSLSVPEAGSCS